MWKSILVALIAGLAVQESALGQTAPYQADVNIAPSNAAPVTVNVTNAAPVTLTVTKPNADAAPVTVTVRKVPPNVTGALSAQNFTCTVVINNYNDDDSRDTIVIVLMPLQVQHVSGQVSGGPGKCWAAPHVGGTNYEAYATCDLGQLPQGAFPKVSRTVTVTSTRSTLLNHKHTCSAFIYSAVGDPDQTNNYATAVPVN